MFFRAKKEKKSRHPAGSKRLRGVRLSLIKSEILLPGRNTLSLDTSALSFHLIAWVASRKRTRFSARPCAFFGTDCMATALRRGKSRSTTGATSVEGDLSALLAAVVNPCKACLYRIHLSESSKSGLARVWCISFSKRSALTLRKLSPPRANEGV